MQTLKCFLLASALAVSSLPVFSQSADTEAQAAARAAMRQKMYQVTGQTPAPVPAAPTTPETPAATNEAVPAPAMTSEPKPVQSARPQPVFPKPGPPAMTPATPVYTPTPVPVEAPAPRIVPSAQASPGTLEAPTPSSPDQIEQARAAMRAKMQELQGQSGEPVYKTTPTPTVVAPATSTPPVATQQMTPGVQSREEIRAAKDREASEKRAEADRAAAERAATKAAKKAEADRAAAERAAEKVAKKTNANQPGAEKHAQKEVKSAPAAELPPLEAPPSAVSASKEAKLKALLENYQADKISAEEYHNQRAKILAEP